jgi:UDP-GlcNAc:undecaprenyl-phosphate/decaprenyl-phosphate GlcNAc-1-phosphate transferase
MLELSQKSWFIYAALFAVVFVYSYFLHKFLLNKSRKYTLRKANVTGLRWNSQTKPVVGGITFYLAFLFTSVLFLFAFDNNLYADTQILGISLVVTISFLMGLADDILSTSPYFKFAVQIISAVILIHFNVVIVVSPDAIINDILTVFWVVGIMNSVNMLDNMDAITSVVAMVILSGVIILEFSSPVAQFSPLLFISTGTFASLAAFLLFNWHPSKMYMGDNGSQFLGALLAVIGIIYFWNPAGSSCYCTNSRQFIVVLLAFLVPICDTTTVTINRLLKRKSPFTGGRDHTTHFLSFLGLKETNIALLFMILSAVSMAFSIYIINFVPEWKMFLFWILSGFVFIVFALLFLNTRITKPK